MGKKEFSIYHIIGIGLGILVCSLGFIWSANAATYTSVDNSGLSNCSNVNLNNTNYFAQTIEPTSSSLYQTKLNIQTPTYYGTGTGTVYLCLGYLLNASSSNITNCVNSDPNVFVASTSWSGTFGNSNNIFEPITVNWGSRTVNLLNNYFVIFHLLSGPNGGTTFGDGTGSSPSGKPFIKSCDWPADGSHLDRYPTKSLKYQIVSDDSVDIVPTFQIQLPAIGYTSTTTVSFLGGVSNANDISISYKYENSSTSFQIYGQTLSGTTTANWDFDYVFPAEGGKKIIMYTASNDYGTSYQEHEITFSGQSIGSIGDWTYSGIFGTSTYYMACSDAEWNSTSTYLGLNFTATKCSVLYSILNIGDKIATAIKGVFNFLVEMVKSIFPFSLPITIFEAWQESEYANLPQTLNLLTNNGELAVGLPENLTGTSTALIFWDINEFTGNQETADILAFFRSLTTYLIYGGWILGLLKWGYSLIQEPEEEYDELTVRTTYK